jgi:hypothetical protein
VEDEGIRGTVLGIAQAANARPKQGIVAAQARLVTKSETMNPREVGYYGSFSRLRNNLSKAISLAIWSEQVVLKRTREKFGFLYAT